MSQATTAAELPVIDSVGSISINAPSTWESFKAMSQVSKLQGIFILGVNVFVTVLLCGLLIPHLF